MRRRWRGHDGSMTMARRAARRHGHPAICDAPPSQTRPHAPSLPALSTVVRRDEHTHIHTHLPPGCCCGGRRPPPPAGGRWRAASFALRSCVRGDFGTKAMRLRRAWEWTRRVVWQQRPFCVNAGAGCPLVRWRGVHRSVDRVRFFFLLLIVLLLPGRLGRKPTAGRKRASIPSC